MTQAQLGLAAFGKADNTAIQSLKKGSSPAIDRLEAVAKALGWEVYFGPPRPPQKKALRFEEASETADLQRVDAFRSSYLPLPWMDPVRGRGSSPVAFQLSWLEKIGLVADHLACIVPDSVLIEGVDRSRVLALVDQKVVRRGYGVWCIFEGDKSIIARVLFQDDALLIQPSDLSSSPRLIQSLKSSSITVRGKVVWLGCQPEEKSA